MSNIVCPDCETDIVTFDGDSRADKSMQITLEVFCPKCKDFTCYVEISDAHRIIFDGVIKDVDQLRTRRPSIKDYSNQIQEEAKHYGN